MVLAFFKTLLLPTQPSFRTLLLDDEEGQTDSQAATLRKEGSHIVTTWEWSRSSKTATFWLRRDVMEEMLRGQSWNVIFWRTDDRANQSGAHRLDVVDTGETWVDAKPLATDGMTGGL